MLYLGHAHLLRDEFEQARHSYQISTEIRNELDQPSLSMEPLAGLVSVCMQMNDLESASLPAEKILKFLADGFTLEGTEYPLRVLYTCYLYLMRIKDLRSTQILKKAKDMLDAQASKFTDETDRKRYIENFSWRRAIWDAALFLQEIS